MTDPIRFLEELVAIESHSGHEEVLARHLVSRMRQLGFEAQVDEAGNAVGLRRGPPAPAGAEREIVLLGHMDTVPGQIPVRIEDGRLHGRGSVDAKGPLATFVLAASRVEPAPGVTLCVVGAVEEESASSKGARHRAPLHRPEACIIGEPSGFDALTLGYKGRLLVDLCIEQPSGHSAGPVGGVGERAIAVWTALVAQTDEINRGRERLFERLQHSLRSLRTESDGLADVARMTIGYRIPPGLEPDALAERIRALATEIAPEAELSFYGAEVPWTSPRTSPLARAFTRAFTRQDLPPRFKHKTGTSDMNVLGPLWGCPFVAYGPGDSTLDHTPEEHVVLAEYERAIGILADALREGGWAT